MDMNNPPDLSLISSESPEERMITFRRFFADLRLNRLNFQLTILNYFSNLDKQDNSQVFANQLTDFVSHFKKMEDWLDELKKIGVYPEFREQCLQEIEAIEQIIQSYERKMNT